MDIPPGFDITMMIKKCEAKEVLLRIERISKSLVWTLHPIYIKRWLLPEPNELYIVHKTFTPIEVDCQIVYLKDIVVIGDDVEKMGKFKN